MAFRFPDPRPPFRFLWNHREVATSTAPSVAVIVGLVALHAFVQAAIDRSAYSIRNGRLNQTGLVRLPEGTTCLLDDTAIATLASQIERCPRVKRIVSLERAFPNSLRLQIDRRQPNAGVLAAGRYFAVDSEYVRLEGDSSTPPITPTGLIIRGVTSEIPAPGQPWATHEMIVAREMTELVSRNKLLRALVKEIDVSNVDGRLSRIEPEITLTCKGDWKLQWGGSPSSVRVGELSTEDKVRNLDKLLRRLRDYGVSSLSELDYAIVYVKDRPIFRTKSRDNARETR